MTGLNPPPVTSTGNWTSLAAVSTQLDSWGWCRNNKQCYINYWISFDPSVMV